MFCLLLVLVLFLLLLFIFFFSFLFVHIFSATALTRNLSFIVVKLCAFYSTQFIYNDKFCYSFLYFYFSSSNFSVSDCRCNCWKTIEHNFCWKLMITNWLNWIESENFFISLVLIIFFYTLRLFCLLFINKLFFIIPFIPSQRL